MPIKTVHALTWSAAFYYNLKPLYHNYWFEFYQHNSRPLTSRQLNSLAPWIRDCSVKHLRFHLMLLINVFNIFSCSFPRGINWMWCQCEPTLVSVMAWWTTIYVAFVVTCRWLINHYLYQCKFALSLTPINKLRWRVNQITFFENDYCKRH